MTNQDINSVWGVIFPILRKLDFHTIKEIAGLAGFDMKILNNLGFYENWGPKPDRDILVTEIGDYFFNFADEKKQRFLNIVMEEILSGRYSLESRDRNERNNLNQRLQYCLERLGWQLIDNKVIPIEVLESSDLNELDPSAREDLIKAAVRFRDGDLNGAIQSAYAAVENVIKRVYQNNTNLGEVNYNKSFQNRCKNALEATGVYTAIDDQLSDFNWEGGEAKEFKKNLAGSVNQAANVLQSLRNKMSDAHGSKPVIKPLAFDSIKWSQLIVRLLSEKYDE